MDKNKLTKYIQKTIIALGYLIITIPLWVEPRSYFPYVYPKAVIFTWLVGLVVAGYLCLLAIDFKKFKPQKSYLLILLILATVWSLICAYFGANFNRSFWGDWERAEGVFLQLNILGLIIVYSSLITDKKQWLKYFRFSLAVSVIVGILGIWQMIGSSISFLPKTDRAFSTLGNAAYLSTYVLWHFFLGLFLWFSAKTKFWQIFIIFGSLLNLVLIFLSGTRGAILGLGAGALAWVAWAIKYKAINYRSKSLIIIIVLIVMAVTIVFLTPLKNNSIFARLADFSIKANTVQTRLLAWQYGLEGFKDHPWLGLGAENYNLVFDKFLTPEIYQYTGNEIWFTRAHNKLVDYLVTEGVVGVVGYLLFLCLIIYSLRKLYKLNKITNHEFVVLVSLIIAYFVQNLFLFDSLVSYLILGLVVAFILSQIRVERTQGMVVASKLSKPLLIFVAIGLVIGSSVLAYDRNLAGRLVYRAFKAAERADYKLMQANFQSAFALIPNPEQPINLMIEAISSSLAKRQDTEQSRNDLVSILEMYQNKISSQANNSFYTMYQRLRSLAYLSEYKDDNSYLQTALDLLPTGVSLSPNNIRLSWMLIQFNSILGNTEKAEEATRQAISKFPDNAIIYWFAGWNHLDKTPSVAYDFINQALDKGFRDFTILEMSRIYSHYVDKQDWSRLIFLQQAYVSKRPTDLDGYFNLADLYIKIRDYVSAKDVLRQVMKIDKTVSDIVYKQIEQIKQLENVK